MSQEMMSSRRKLEGEAAASESSCKIRFLEHYVSGVKARESKQRQRAAEGVAPVHTCPKKKFNCMALCVIRSPPNFTDRSLAGKLKRMEEAEDKQRMSVRHMSQLDRACPIKRRFILRVRAKWQRLAKS